VQLLLCYYVLREKSFFAGLGFVSGKNKHISATNIVDCSAVIIETSLTPERPLSCMADDPTTMSPPAGTSLAKDIGEATSTCAGELECRI
jgi:hypothetical protein